MAGRAGPSESWGGMSTGLAISSTMLAAVAVWGGVGYLIDHLAGTGRILTAIGMVVGAVSGIYLIYLKHGRPDDPKN